MKWRNAGYFWLGLLLFIIGYHILDHLQKLDAINTIIVSFLLAMYIVANVCSWFGLIS